MLRIYDVSLRDGNHAVRHTITTEQIATYCREIDDSGVDFVEVGHGIGLGASSLLIGEAKITDQEVLETARANLKSTKLSVHVVPGYATCKKDLEPAIALGVDAIRVATQCSEADTAMQHLEFVREQGVSAFSGLMMSHMLSPEELVQQAKKLESYGAETITLLDSAGKFLPKDVYQRIALLADHLQVPVGFHAHNNLGLAISNSLAAIEAGANMIDASIIGFGAGAGNAALEVLTGACIASEVETKLDLYKILDIAEYAESLMGYRPYISSDSIVSGLTGVVSVFSKPVRKAADHYGVDPRDIYFELGKRKAIAGQEDLIFEVAAELAGRS